jgi:hypothetical protein
MANSVQVTLGSDPVGFTAGARMDKRPPSQLQPKIEEPGAARAETSKQRQAKVDHILRWLLLLLLAAYLVAIAWSLTSSRTTTRSSKSSRCEPMS